MQIVIEPVTERNRSIAEKLEVYSDQSGYIESVKECMQEADQLKDWRPVCIVNDGTIVGFAMYGRIREDKRARLWFDRLLIDKNYQGRGYAKQAMNIFLKQWQINIPIWIFI